MVLHSCFHRLCGVESTFTEHHSAGFVNFRRGYGNMRLHGQSYHRCLAGNATGGIEYYLYDRSYEQMCAALPAAIPRQLLDRLRQMLFRENPLVQAIRSMATVDGDTATLVLRHKVNTNEMASFVLEDNGDDHVRARDIVFHRHTDASPTFVHVNSPMYDTLQFPLLHPFGGVTWYPRCTVNTRRITLAQYTKYLHLQDPHERLRRL